MRSANSTSKDADEVQECANVQVERYSWQRCWFGKRKGDGQQGEGPEGWQVDIANGEE